MVTPQPAEFHAVQRQDSSSDPDPSIVIRICSQNLPLGPCICRKQYHRTGHPIVSVVDPTRPTLLSANSRALHQTEKAEEGQAHVCTLRCKAPSKCIPTTRWTPSGSRQVTHSCSRREIFSALVFHLSLVFSVTYLHLEALRVRQGYRSVLHQGTGAPVNAAHDPVFCWTLQGVCSAATPTRHSSGSRRRRQRALPNKSSRVLLSRTIWNQ